MRFARIVALGGKTVVHGGEAHDTGDDVAELLRPYLVSNPSHNASMEIYDVI